MPNFIKIGQTVAEIWRFNYFQNGGRPPSWICEIRILASPFWISKIRNFNDRSAVRGQYASLYQILSKSVKQLQKYMDLTVFFKMAAFRHLGFAGRRLRPPTTSS